MASRRPELRIAPKPAPSPVAHAGVIASAADGEHLILRHGLAGLGAALDRTEHDTGWGHFWRGYAMQFSDLALARAEWLRAEPCFERDDDVPGLDLAACARVQCAMLDSLSYTGFDQHAVRVAQAATDVEAMTPLALFRMAARMLLAAERREPIKSVSADIDCAFAALGANLDPEITLRATTAALPMLGLGLDRVRLDDFCQAGARLAASPRVGDYSRALWHVYVVEARFYDATAAARLRVALDAIDRLDLYPSFVDAQGRQEARLFVDGLHPSEAGYRLWRDRLVPALASARTLAR